MSDHRDLIKDVAAKRRPGHTSAPPAPLGLSENLLCGLEPATLAPAAPPYDPEGVNESIRQQLRDQSAEQFAQQAKGLADICEKLRTGTGRAIETFVKMAYKEGYSAGEAFCTAHTQVYERVQQLESMYHAKDIVAGKLAWQGWLLEERLFKLREWMIWHGEHSENCSFHSATAEQLRLDWTNRPCTCGLRAALTEDSNAE